MKEMRGRLTLGAHLLRAAVAVALALAPGAAQLSAQRPVELSTEAVAKRATPATVTIITFDAQGDTLGSGSGFLVRPNGVLVTSWHVMTNAHSASVILASGERYERVEVLDGDAGADLAILKIPGYGLPVLVARADLPPVGSRIIVIGSPRGLARTVSEGIVSATRLNDGRELLQMSAAISPGSSGGPVLDSRGQVIAVSRSYLENGQQLNFAVPVRYAMGLVDGAPAPRPLAGYFAAQEGQEGSDGPQATSRPTTTTHAGVRATQVGTYEGARVVTTPERRVFLRTWLLVAGEDRGFLVSQPDTLMERYLVSNLMRLWWDEGGRMVLDDGLFELEGGEDDEGDIVLTGRAKPAFRGKLDSSYVAVTPVSYSLLVRTGIYRISVRTTASGAATDWQGRAAVVAANDSVYVDLALRNDAGGSVGFNAAGPVRDDSFSLTSDDGKRRLKGSFSTGSFVAEWRDRREGGTTFNGVMRGARE